MNEGPIVCVVAFVLDEAGRLLLVRSKKRGGWELPGGKMRRQGETWRQAMARETLEETGVGIAIEPGPPFEVMDCGPALGADFNSVVLIARAFGSGMPLAGSDAIEAEWFAPSAIPWADLSRIGSAKAVEGAFRRAASPPGSAVTIATWLGEPWPGKFPCEHADISDPLRGFCTAPYTRLQVLTCLIGMNNGLSVHEYGFMTSGRDCGPYGRRGLDQVEAHTLMQHGAFVEGWLAAQSSPTEQQIFSEAINGELARVMAIRTAMLAQLDADQAASAAQVPE